VVAEYRAGCTPIAEAGAVNPFSAVPPQFGVPAHQGRPTISAALPVIMLGGG
jgi:hypothetical protein